MLFLDFLVEPENEEDGGKEDGGDDQTEEDGRCWIETIINLGGPDERHAPKYHGCDTSKVNQKILVFHGRKSRLFFASTPKSIHFGKIIVYLHKRKMFEFEVLTIKNYSK